MKKIRIEAIRITVLMTLVILSSCKKDLSVTDSNESFVSGSLKLDSGTFYNPDKNGNTEVTISNLTGTEANDDSNSLNTAIESLSNKEATNGRKGGTLTLVPNGNITTLYLQDIAIMSNVHLKIDPSFTIIPQTIGGRVFEMGDSGYVENVALTSITDSTDKSMAFKVQLRAAVNQKESVLKIGNVSNFRVAGINILDNKTKLSGVTMSIQGNTLTDKSKIPRNGIVENLWIDNAHVGYGLVQAQAAKHIFFKNLNGVGGVTMRFESGDVHLLQSVDSSVDSVYVEDVSITDGDAALNLSPHRSNQGSLNAVGVKAYNSTWAVEVAAGFIGNHAGIAPPFVNNNGTYESVNIEIEEIRGGKGAQIKGKDFSLFACDSVEKARLNIALTKDVKKTTDCVIGNSIGGARANASIDCQGEGCYSANITYATASNTSGSFQLGPLGYGETPPNCTNNTTKTETK